MDVQIRTEDGELRYFGSVTDAFEHAEQHPEVWKISWADVNGKRVRLVRHDFSDTGIVWEYKPILGGGAE